MAPAFIGLYDSGLGGMSVMRSVRTLLPTHNLYYLADTAYCPYGMRSIAEIRARARMCTIWLVAHGATMVVVACNTATSAAIDTLRSEFAIPIIGMEPGVKPAIATTHTRHVGIMATHATLRGMRFAALIERYAKDVAVQPIPCTELVTQVETGNFTGEQTRHIIQQCLAPIAHTDVDTIVLGCTHFHFVAPLIAELAGRTITIIDTSNAVARRVATIANDIGMTGGDAICAFATTGQIDHVQPVMQHLWDKTVSLTFADC